MDSLPGPDVPIPTYKGGGKERGSHNTPSQKGLKKSLTRGRQGPSFLGEKGKERGKTALLSRATRSGGDNPDVPLLALGKRGYG